MKKLLTLVALACATSFASAQGLINWANTSGTLISLNGASMPFNSGGASAYNFGLFVAPVGTAAPDMGGPGGLAGIGDANWQFVAAYTVNSTAAAGGGRMLNPGVATVTGFAAGTSVNFIIRAWQSASGGNDWAAARPGITYLGTSALGSALLGGGAIGTPSAFGVGAGQIGGFNVVPVPEPSSMALAGLGAASLLLFRRRK
jgi:hypothetical protein